MGYDIDTGDDEDNFREFYGDRRPQSEIDQERETRASGKPIAEVE